MNEICISSKSMGWSVEWKFIKISGWGDRNKMAWGLLIRVSCILAWISSQCYQWTFLMGWRHKHRFIIIMVNLTFYSNVNLCSVLWPGRLQKLTCSTISIRQLVNWVYMTQHWPYHTAWLIAMLEDVSSTDNSAPASTGMSELIVTVSFINTLNYGNFVNNIHCRQQKLNPHWNDMNIYWKAYMTFKTSQTK